MIPSPENIKHTPLRKNNVVDVVGNSTSLGPFFGGV